jgi:type I restriction enzyme S subunit
MNRTENSLPQNWRLRSLDSLGKVLSGATPSTRVPDFWNGDIAWITPADLSRQETPFINSTERNISEKGMRGCAATLIPKNNLVVSSRAPIGYVAIPTMEFCTNQGCKSIWLDKQQDSLFHYYNLCFHIKKLKDKGEGTTFAEISKTALGAVQLPVPDSKHTQSKVGEVLSAADEAIEKLSNHICKLERIKVGLRQVLLSRGIDQKGRIRDPLGSDDFTDSEFGRIPKSWRPCTLNEIVDRRRPIVYGILMPGTGFSGGVPVVKVKDIVGGTIDLADLLLTDPKIDEAYKRSRLRAGDLLFTIRGTVGRMAFVPESLDGANITQDTARIAIKGAVRGFIRHFLEMPTPRRFVDIHTIGQAVRGINLLEVRRIPILCPPEGEQQLLADILDSQDAVVSRERDRLENLRRLRTGLMQDLLTCRVSVEPLVNMELTTIQS